MPVDPNAPPKYPGGHYSSLYSGCVIDKDGNEHDICRSQYCCMPCEYCEKNPIVMIKGYQKK